jgi:hypothetical protein
LLNSNENRASAGPSDAAPWRALSEGGGKPPHSEGEL